MSDFNIKQNDRLPSLDATLTSADGSPVDLTGAAVLFLMRLGATVKVNAAAAIIDAVNGEVQYAWAAVDTNAPAIYEAEFQVTFADTRKETFPNDRYLEIAVLAEVA